MVSLFLPTQKLSFVGKKIQIKIKVDLLLVLLFDCQTWSPSRTLRLTLAI